MTYSVDSLRQSLEGHYAGYRDKSAGERFILAMAWICDVWCPRESTGNNDGPAVEAILANVGLDKGNPWCAAAGCMAADAANVPRPHENPASVLYGWAPFCRKNMKRSSFNRCDVLLRDHGGGKGHFGACVRSLGLWVYSIEGNTSPGEEGSQRDGQGMYRRVRLKSFWNKGAWTW